MKRLIFLIVLLIPLITVAQQRANATLNGTQFEQTSRRQTVQRDSTTTYTFKDNSGKVYPVYKSVNGKYYVWRDSRNGNKYKFYIKVED